MRLVYPEKLTGGLVIALMGQLRAKFAWFSSTLERRSSY